MDNRISDFLKGVSNAIAEFYKDGKNFNIFEVIRKQDKELVHSAFIAELLNPKGSHGCKDLFLGKFLEIPKIADANCVKIFKSKFENVEVKTEYSKGVDGRMDILLSHLENRIVIENKIWAEDQEEQIKRYFKSKNVSKIIYLTPYGHKPSNSSLGLKDGEDRTNAMENVICISYQEHILGWLEACLIELKNAYLEFSVKQYIDAIKGILNMKENNKENAIFDKIFESEKNYSTFKDIKSADPRAYIYRKIEEKIVSDKVAEKSNIEISDNKIMVKGDGIYWGLESNARSDDIAINFWIDDPKFSNSKKRIKEAFFNFFQNKSYKNNNWFDFKDPVYAENNECFCYAYLFGGKSAIVDKYGEDKDAFLEKMSDLMKKMKEIAKSASSEEAGH